ncbi:hypothetical protein PBI_VANISOA_50 [Mycobacterium phage Vanisoa]|nr:hypothetical protein PBI_VANISOA_50 [Mycobacterium phage Vanisoa]
MSYEDPFEDAPADSAPAEEAQQQTEPTPAPAPKPAAVVTNNVSGSGDLSVTFKGDGSYSAPWLVPKYASVSDALVDLGEDPAKVTGLSQAQKWFALFERVTKMGKHYASLGGGSTAPAGNAGGGGGGGGQRQSAPQAAKEAPNGEKKFCQHGEMEYKSGTSKKTGKPYALFSCTAPRDQQCDAQWPAK